MPTYENFLNLIFSILVSASNKYIMKTSRFLFYLIMIAFILGACTYCSKGPDRTPESKIKKKALVIAERYASAQLRNPKKTVSSTGIITLNDDQKKYIIYPSKVFIGLIDKDSNLDALVSIVSLRGQELDQIEHLIILKTNGKFMLIKSIESDMNVLQVKDGIITAQIHTRPRNSPLYYCSSCLEIVKFKFMEGELVKI